MKYLQQGEIKDIFSKYCEPDTKKKLLISVFFMLIRTLWNKVGAFWQYEPA